MKSIPLLIALCLIATTLTAQTPQYVLAFGDSITWGYGLTHPETQAWPAIVAKARGWTLVNLARQGTQAEDPGQAVAVFEQPITTSSRSLLLTGYNDMRMWGMNQWGLDTFEGTFRAMLVRLATPATMRIDGQSAVIATTGAWHNMDSSEYPADLGIYTTDPTATATATTKILGTTVYITSMKLASGGGSFTVSVDGVDRGTFWCNFALPTKNGTIYAPFVVRVPNLEPGFHTVAIRAASPGYIYLVSISGNAFLPKQTTEVWAGNCLPMKVYEDAGAAAAFRKYNDIIRDVVRELQDDGLNVGFVDVAKVYRPATMFSEDGIHPNAKGQQTIAETFLSAMNSAAVSTKSAATAGAARRPPRESAHRPRSSRAAAPSTD